jgi:hypothetical protein
MPILVSFCVRSDKGRFALGMLQGRTLALQPLPALLQFPQPPELAGLAADSRFVYVAVRSPSGLVVLDRQNLYLLHQHDLPEADDLHSLCVREEQLYVVSTGTDEVLCLQMRGPHIVSQSVVWRPGPSSSHTDTHHLNGLCFSGEDLCVCGFGQRTRRDDWDSACKGFLYNISREEMVSTGLDHPHSPLALENGVACCESGSGSVLVPGRGAIRDLPGYPRGLCRVGEHLFVGTSAFRTVSRSSGKRRLGLGSGIPAARSTVTRINLRTGASDLETDLSWHGGEIYDLLPLDP